MAWEGGAGDMKQDSHSWEVSERPVALVSGLMKGKEKQNKNINPNPVGCLPAIRNMVQAKADVGQEGNYRPEMRDKSAETS